MDYFALGALVHEMLVGLPPFYSDNLQTMLRDIQWREPKIPSHLPKAAKSVIVGLLHKKPEKRLVGPPLRAHPFFEGTDWEALERLEVPACLPACLFVHPGALSVFLSLCGVSLVLVR